jgi:hypothetical protein
VADEPKINPYAPPSSELEATSQQVAAGAFAKPLFSPGQAGAAAFFGSVVAGVILMQANFRVMGRSRDANLALMLGVLFTAGLVALTLVLPKNIPTTPINVAVAVGFYKLANSLQGQSFFNHRTAGGARHSNWLVFGIIVASAVALVVVLFAVLFAAGAFKGLE